MKDLAEANYNELVGAAAWVEEKIHSPAKLRSFDSLEKNFATGDGKALIDGIVTLLISFFPGKMKLALLIVYDVLTSIIQAKSKRKDSRIPFLKKIGLSGKVLKNVLKLIKVLFSKKPKRHS